MLLVVFNRGGGEAGPVTPPAAPSQLSASEASSSSIRLEWTDNSPDEDGFRVERSLDGVSFTQIASVGPNVKYYTDNGLAVSTVYYYRVLAYNSGGNSDYSNTAFASVRDLALDEGPTWRVKVEGGRFRLTPVWPTILRVDHRDAGKAGLPAAGLAGKSVEAVRRSPPTPLPPPLPILRRYRSWCRAAEPVMECSSIHRKRKVYGVAEGRRAGLRLTAQSQSRAVFAHRCVRQAVEDELLLWGVL